MKDKGADQSSDKIIKLEMQIQELGKSVAKFLQSLGKQHPNYEETKKYYSSKINYLERLRDIELNKSSLRHPNDQTLIEDIESQMKVLEKKWLLNEKKRKDAADLLHPEDKTVSASDDDD